VKRTFFSFPYSLKENIPQVMNWAMENFSRIAFYNSGNESSNDPYSCYQSLLAVGSHEHICSDGGEDAFQMLKNFSDKHNDWLFGFFSYDLKNQVEKLTSENQDGLNFPLMHFFIPEIVFKFEEEIVEIGILDGEISDAEKIIQQIKSAEYQQTFPEHINVKHKVSRQEYLNKIDHIKSHIQQGDIYEMNFCMEFFAENAQVNPVDAYVRLNDMSPAPFSCFYRYDQKFLISSTPERFLAKRGNKLISQPIKGTISRGETPEQDQVFKNILANDPKERSENIMIVDLVRNDLSATAVAGSVFVEELCGIYSFARVHQMISTVVSELDDRFHFVDAIRNAFPMGSMTGAPKIKAMELIEQYEKTKRGLYSGAVGYICPGKNFDFNVVIRSILLNQAQQYISFMAGSAITISSDPEKEYHECLLKAGAMAAVLGSSFN
jgi:para-aminobenzoate synthetase component I